MSSQQLNHMIDHPPSHVLEHGALNMSTGYDLNNALLPQYMTHQIGVCGDHSFHGGNGIFGFDGDLFVPPLENVGIEEKPKSTHDHENGSYKNYRTENLARIGNYWEVEEFRMGEWDFEELMKDVPTFPLLDFQVQ